ncbi:unnamed protein product [Dibothriocephalus latus]|uniref:Uncharacterized protein n=1 Tax=Dibothriocephalus latus TaxID=60516 RepID=A0A3P7M0M4_DIBLA|nr:unnamed protein product [Dibothriocephalus latus]
MGLFGSSYPNWRVKELNNELSLSHLRTFKKGVSGLLVNEELANLIISLKELLSQRVSPSLARLLQNTSTSSGDFTASQRLGRASADNEKTATVINDTLKSPGSLYSHAKWLQSAIHVTRVAGRMDSFVEEVLSLAKATQAKHPLIKRLSGGCNNGRELSTKLSAPRGDLDQYAREGQIPPWNMVGGTINMAHRPPSALDLSLMPLPGLTDDAPRLSDFPYGGLIRPLQQSAEEWLEYPQYSSISVPHTTEPYESCMVAVPDYFGNPYSCDMIYQSQPTPSTAPEVFGGLAPTSSSPTPVQASSISAVTSSRLINEQPSFPKKSDSKSENDLAKDGGSDLSPLFYVPQQDCKMPYIGASMTASKLTPLTDYAITATELSPLQTTPLTAGSTTAALESGNGGSCQPCLQVIT